MTELQKKKKKKQKRMKERKKERIRTVIELHFKYFGIWYVWRSMLPWNGIYECSINARPQVNASTSDKRQNRQNPDLSV